MTKKPKFPTAQTPWLMGPLQAAPERPLIDILRHEAGHMVVARVLGFETGDLILQLGNAGAEINPEPKLSSLQEVVTYMKKRMAILYAGVLAESLKDQKVQNDKAIALSNGIEGADDHSKVSEFSKIASGIECGNRPFREVASEIEGAVWNRSATLVEKYAPQIVTLSKEWRLIIGGAQQFKIPAADIRKIEVFAKIVPGCESEQA